MARRVCRGNARLVPTSERDAHTTTLVIPRYTAAPARSRKDATTRALWPSTVLRVAFVLLPLGNNSDRRDERPLFTLPFSIMDKLRRQLSGPYTVTRCELLTAADMHVFMRIYSA